MASAADIFKCEMCKKPCKSLKLYLKHGRQHKPEELGKKWSQCQYCDQFFPTDFDKQSHGLKEHSESVSFIKCYYCPIETPNNKGFFNHAIESHSNLVESMWLKCKQCDDYRPSKISMNVHVKSSHAKGIEEEPLILERKVTQIKCKYCPVIFNTSDEYKEHLLTSHVKKELPTEPSKPPPIQLLPVISSVSSGFECEFCLHFQAFSTRTEYLQHVQNIHKSDAIAKNWVLCVPCQNYTPLEWRTDHDCTGKALTQNYCSFCDMHFTSKEAWFEHMDVSHPDHALFQHSCDVCNVKRPDKTSLMMHKLTHLKNNAGGPKLTIVTSKNRDKYKTGI